MATIRLYSGVTILALGLLAMPLCAGDPPSLQVTTLPSGAELQDLGDVDGDGVLDLVALYTGSLVVHLGDGLGGFADGFVTPISVSSAETLQVADFNGDGLADVGVIGTSVRTLLATGAGTFAQVVTVPGSTGLSKAAFGDMNGDGLDDIVTLTGLDAQLRVHESLGSAGFSPVSLVATNGILAQVVLADMNGDGLDDAVLHHSSCVVPGCAPVVVRFSQLGGGFGADLAVTASPPQASDSLLAHDMDGDGNADVLVRDGSDWLLHLSDGTGLFSAPTVVADADHDFDERMFTDENRDGLVDVLVQVASGVQPAWELAVQTSTHGFVSGSPLSDSTAKLMLAGDVNRDGAPDRILAWSPFLGPTQVVALLGNGHGELRNAWSGAGVYDPHVADVDLDGYPDVMIYGEVRIAKGLPAGRLGDLQSVGINAGWLRVADMDGDGLLDLVTSTRPGSSVPAATLHVNLATAPAVFAADPTPLALTANEQQLALELGDLDGDGDIDAVRVSDDFSQANRLVHTVLNDGAGGLSIAFTRFTSMAPKVNTVRLGDLDLDGDLDLLIAAGKITDMRTALNGGFGQFAAITTAIPSAEQATLQDSVLGDSDGDGLLDLHAGGFFTDILARGLGRFGGLGDGTFGPLAAFSQGTFDLLGMGLLAGDINDDGNLDVVAEGEGMYLWLGDGLGGFTVQTSLQGPGDTNVGFRGTLGDVNGDGALDIVHCGRLGLVSYGAGPWTQLGESLAGVDGHSRLSGGGPLTPGSTVDLLIEYASPSAAGQLVLGLTSLSAPFKGGTLVPFPDVLLPFNTDLAGEALITSTWPAGTPSGFQFFVQAWFVPGTPAATTAMAAVVP